VISLVESLSRRLGSILSRLPALVSLLVVTGCERASPRVYDISLVAEAPFEVKTAPVEAGTSALFEGLAWDVPQAWSDAPVGPMRLVVYTAVEGAVELSVSRFPGDVGGDLANINRWRRQLGLSPVLDLNSVDGLQAEQNGSIMAQRIELFTDASEGSSGMYMHWFNYQGYTWFFKANGTRKPLIEIRSDYDSWIQSINASAEGE